ncbi:squalene--hopene cyclase [Blastococcus saxobsidens]|uniref:Squalene-hopene cyclase n=1 Tax=Blastococcus saxobsidens (strain DD2) TaxID=1146883 RepID=H6RL60_BLASD|nr:squalene--hopene cyclase [Blastococcus saxobsidens]CCG01190.1 Squalene-hopene cyclase [Blastococcus saxobsidens DD2]
MPAPSPSTTAPGRLAAPPRGREGAAATALAAGRDWLLARQEPGGWWQGELETNVTMDAEDLLLREFLGIRTDAETAETAAWIRSRQRDDGSWATYTGGPGDLSTTVEAYVALRLAGDDPGSAHLRRAAGFVVAHGGLEASRVFTRFWLAMFGEEPWARLPVLPPELVLLPRRMPLNVYDFASWARQTIVPLAVVGALRPRRPLPFGLAELRAGAAPPARPVSPVGRAFLGLDRLLHRYERRPLKGLRRLALARAERWILERQEADGSWGGIQPPWVYSLIALHLLGHPLDSPAVQAGLAGLDRFTVRSGGLRRLEACQSPVWDTALTVLALTDAGVPGDDPALRRAAGWLVGEEIRIRGDWSVRRPDLVPSGWAFEFDNDWYPDVDDTAEVALALCRTAAAEADGGPARAAVDRGVAWLVGMQSRDGGWGAFDADNTSRLCRHLPFLDFGEVTDPPSADVTAHVVETLAHTGAAGSPAARRGVDWLLDAQEPDGSWFGRWGVNHVYGTGAVVPALVAAGVDPGARPIRRAVSWLEEHQGADGGWGEDPRSYTDPAWRGRGRPTASQTAWALLALLAAGERGPAVERGIGWLTATQRPDGSWDEPEFTGTGFPGDFFINYHLYRQVFPLMALGRYLGEGRTR